MTKKQRQFNGERIAFSINGIQTLQYPHTHTHTNPDQVLTTFTKINSKWILDLYAKCKNIKLLQNRDFPGGLTVRIPGCHCCGPGSFLVKEMRSCKLHGTAKKNERKKTANNRSKSRMSK